MTHDTTTPVRSGRHAALLAAAAANIPQAMRERKQWLVWKFIRKAGANKPAKMPYYVSGHLRGWPHGMPPHAPGTKAEPTDAQPQVDQGHELDRQALATFDEVYALMASTARWDGIGFAFLPGDGLIGIDVDHAIDPDTGEMAEQCRDIIERCASYTELSPSGTGVHVIVEGETKTFKDNDVGIEVFCGRQFFTVTARPCGQVPQVQPISPEALAWLHELVKGKPSEAAQAPRSAQAKPGTEHEARYCLSALQSAVQRMRGAGSGKRNDTLNAEAYGLAQLLHTGHISEWTIRGALGDAASAAGLDNAEIEATLGSAIRAGQASPRDVPEPKRRIQLVKPEPPAEGEPKAANDGRPEPPDDAAPVPPAADDGAAAPKKGKGGAKKSKPADNQIDETAEKAKEEAQRIFWERVDAMCERFVLVEATDEVWDNVQFTLWKVANMRIRFGRPIVNAWLARVASNRAKTVKLTDLVFEPGQQCEPHQINMFDRLEVEPVVCTKEDVRPMLDLLYHLCSESGDAPGEEFSLMHWILCWQAYPVQHIGAKMQTSAIFHGAQGTGKNAYWDMWRDLFGVYGRTISQTEIEDKFNNWVSRALALIGDEVVTRQEMYHNKNKLKLVVTQSTRFPIRSMGKDTRWESNHANVVFLSNESQPLALEDRDRRYLVIYTPLEADVPIYQAVEQFKRDKGLGKWLYFLQHYPLGDFGPHTKPPMTKAKELLIQLNWKPQQRFAYEWLHGFLELPVRVCSAEQLYRAFRRWCDRQGERWPPPQAMFTRDVERWAGERVKRDDRGVFEEPLLRYKQIALKNNITNARKTVRCWVPKGSGPSEMVSEGEWAYESVQAFESDLSRYCRSQINAHEEVE